MRLNTPITGPAHQTACGGRRAASSRSSSGLTPIEASSASTLAAMWTSGPGQRDQRLGAPRQIGRRADERGVAGHEVERDLGLGAGPRAADGVAELVHSVNPAMRRRPATARTRRR